MNPLLYIKLMLAGMLYLGNVQHSPGEGVIYRSPMFYLPYCGAQTSGPAYATVQVTMNAGNCETSLHAGCPVVRIIDSASHASWPLPAGGYINLPARRTYYVHADLSGVTDTVLVKRFYVVVGWEECG